MPRKIIFLNRRVRLDKFETYDWVVTKENAGERVDKYLSDQFEGWSRSLVQIWIKEGNVKIDNKLIKANYKLVEGNEIILEVPPQKELAVEPEDILLEIVYEDSDLIVINKAKGMTVHPAPGPYRAGVTI